MTHSLKQCFADEYETSDDEISSKTTSEDEASEEGVIKESSNSIEVQKYTSSPSTEVNSKEISSQNSCEWDEFDELHDEWATEQTMKLLAGDFGGPNILESVFGRTREGELIEKVKPSSSSTLPRTRGGAIGDETYCKGLV